MKEISTLDELMAVALAAERNAVRAYHALAGQMEQYGNKELAQLFNRLAAEEAKHDQEISRLAVHLGGRAEPASEAPMWRDPAAALVDRDDATNPATSTPYKALAYAVDNEELAFRFFSYVAANASDERMRRIAEAFAREELGHAALLRAQRRRAFHAQRKTAANDWFPDPSTIRGLPDFLTAAVAIESNLADRIVAIDENDDRVRALAQQIRSNVETMSREVDTHAGTASPQALREATAGSDTVPANPGNAPRDTLAALDRAFAFYDGVVQLARDEALGNKAQALAALILDRMNTLREITERHPG